MLWERRSPVSSVRLTPKWSQIELLDLLDRDHRGLTLREDVAQHVLGELDVHPPTRQRAKATTRVSAPSSSRMFVETRLAM